MTRLVVQNIGALYTLSGNGKAGGAKPSADPPIEYAEIIVEDGAVQFAGPSRDESWHRHRPTSQVPYPDAPRVVHRDPDLTVIDAQGALATPGLVDPHTHVLYAGNRANETALKLAGVPYLDILARGGGILSTVRATRESSDTEIYRSTARRLLTMLAFGTTTVEVKSGYGLSLGEELRTLRIAHDLNRDLPISVVPTFLGAHAIPEEHKSDADRYIDIIVDQMIPAVAQAGLSAFCDVFCEASVFSVDQATRILESGNVHGLRGKVHADEIEPTGGAELAAEQGAISADHLRATSAYGMQRLAESGVIPVVLPATSFNLTGNQHADARRMIDEFDLPVALATDDNPGTSPTESLQFVMTLAALELRMTPEEILAGVTINAARAIGVDHVAGSLEPGKTGDFIIWEAYDLAMLPYRFGVNQAAVVVKAGEVVSGLKV